jgi:hypothetical protein
MPGRTAVTPHHLLTLAAGSHSWCTSQPDTGAPTGVLPDGGGQVGE